MSRLGLFKPQLLCPWGPSFCPVHTWGTQAVQVRHLSVPGAEGMVQEHGVSANNFIHVVLIHFLLLFSFHSLGVSKKVIV